MWTIGHCERIERVKLHLALVIFSSAWILELSIVVDTNSFKNCSRIGPEEREALLEVPNAFPYQRIIETEKAGYLIRQYFFSSLYDRIRCV